ncbi:MAG: hypothetical protein DRJ03_28185 [Chloroflexi bacterium]|nr:MAG: hypothetical protein DRJ03_28185 [Chloroflexota bacterium]
MLVGLTACLPAAPAAPTLAPTLTHTPVPTSGQSRGLLLLRGPYLQSVAANSIIVAWETDRPSHGEVVYGEAEEYGASVADPALGARHVVTLTGLAPYTLYHYRIVSDGEPLGADAAFRTAAGPDQAEFTFVVFGDTRTQHQVHREVVARILEQGTDFVLHTGDLVDNGWDTGQWAAFFEIERELMARASLFPALGNHESNSPLYFDFFHLPGNERWYTFDYGNARFVCLQVDGFADFGPGSEQYGWLEETLVANTQPWLFVYFHVPLYGSVPPHSAPFAEMEETAQRALAPLFERYGVDMVFSGHKHSYERNEVNGVTYIVTAGGGAPLYWAGEREPTQAAFARAYHFVLLEIDGDCLKATTISVEGEVLDQLERRIDAATLPFLPGQD